ncbi:MAG TPA: hypothetical protein VMT67_04810 [Terriglobales bacterium]|nr:hypothetical protein [Terriglobales bacterium]
MVAVKQDAVKQDVLKKVAVQQVAAENDVKSDGKAEPIETTKERRFNWLWPLGVAATGAAGMLLLALRGCWHRQMSWPVRAQGRSYQVCLGCGVKRLFDERNFCSYGPFRYDLNELIEWDQGHKADPSSIAHSQRNAS